jgi:hypothetical protein
LRRHVDIGQRRRNRLAKLINLAFHRHVVGHQHVGQARAVVVVERVAAQGDAADLDERCRDLRAEVAGVLAERAVRRVLAGRGEALDHDLGVRRHQDVGAVRQRRHEPQRGAQHAARGAPVALRIVELRLRADHHGRVVSDPESHRARAAGRPVLPEVARVVRRRVREPRHLPGPLQPAALDRGVVHAGVGIARGRVRGGEVRAGLEFVLDERRQAGQIRLGAAQDALAYRRLARRDQHRRDRAGRPGGEPARGVPVVLEAERRGGQSPARGEVRDDGDGAHAAIRQARLAGAYDRESSGGVQTVLQRRELVADAHRLAELEYGGRVRGEEASQVGARHRCPRGAVQVVICT